MDQRILDARPLAERRVVLVYLTLCCLTLAHAVYIGYAEYFAGIQSNHPGVTQQEYYKLHSTIAVSSDHPLFRGEDFAPDQYRIGVVFAGKYLADLLGVTKYYLCYSVFDFSCAFAIGMLSYRALAGSEFFRKLVEAERRLAVLLMLLALLYPFAWTVPWERPETLPSGLYLVFCVASIGRLSARRGLLFGVWAATIWQSFVRTDIPLTLGTALLLVGCTSIGARLMKTRVACIGVGASLVGIAVPVQAYLQFARYPAAFYPPGVGKIHSMGNLQPRQLVVFVIALLPWALLMWLLVRNREEIEAVDILAAVASCLYLPLWWTVGILAEVRLFVPFLLALTPTAAKLVVLSCGEDGPEAGGFAGEGQTV